MTTGTAAAGYSSRENLSIRGLMTRGSRIFDESLDAIRQAVVLQFECANLRTLIDRGLHAAVTPRQLRARPSSLGILSPREITVVRLIVEGKTTKEIASFLGIAFKTAAAHRSHIMTKLEVTNSAAVVREAFRLGLLDE
jgi:DNA-binding CsgD family transcriptional regulator